MSWGIDDPRKFHWSAGTSSCRLHEQLGRLEPGAAEDRAWRAPTGAAKEDDVAVLDVETLGEFGLSRRR